MTGLVLLLLVGSAVCALLATVGVGPPRVNLLALAVFLLVAALAAPLVDAVF